MPWKEAKIVSWSKNCFIPHQSFHPFLRQRIYSSQSISSNRFNNQFLFLSSFCPNQSNGRRKFKSVFSISLVKFISWINLTRNRRKIAFSAVFKKEVLFLYCRILLSHCLHGQIGIVRFFGSNSKNRL